MQTLSSARQLATLQNRSGDVPIPRSMTVLSGSGSPSFSGAFGRLNETSVLHHERSARLLYTKLLLVSALFIVIAFVLLPSYSNSITMERLGAIVIVNEGTVDILRDSMGIRETISQGSQVGLQINDMISSEAGRATIQFFGEQMVELQPGSRVTLERYEIQDRAKRLEYMVWAGGVRHQMAQATGVRDWIQISTPTSSATIRNAVIGVEVAHKDLTTYRVEEGVARITMHDQEIFLAPREIAHVSPHRSLTKYRAGVRESYPGVVTTDSDGSGSDRIITTVADLLSRTASQSDRGDIDTTRQIQAKASPAFSDWHLYVVKPGETFWTIAAQHSISVGELSKANPDITNIEVLRVGQTIRVPRLLN